MPSQTVTRSLNRINFTGRLNAEAVPLLLEAMRAAEFTGFEDFDLDFSQCSQAYPNGTVPLAALADAWRSQGFDFELILPADASIARLFENTGLAHFIAPGKHGPTTFHSAKHIPIQRFQNHTEQVALVYSFGSPLFSVEPHNWGKRSLPATK